MTLQQLQYFAAVAEHLSFSRAARQHYVSQTAVSQQVRLLEQELGVQLLERNRRWVRLTRAGSAYYQYALQILELVQAAAARARAVGNATPQALAGGIMRGLEGTAFVEQLLDLQAADPGLTIQLRPGNYQQLQQLLETGGLDFILVTRLYAAPQATALRRLCVGQAAHYAVVNRQSHLAGHERLRRSELRGEVFCTLPLQQSTWVQFSRSLQQSGMDTQKLMFCDTLEAVALQIAFHGGYTVLAEPVLRQLPANKNLVAIPLQDDTVPIDLMWSETNENPALAALLQSRASGADT